MMKDKSIRDTAIITITLIGGLFLLQKCNGNEVKIAKRDIKIEKISQKEGHSQKDTLQEGSQAHSLVDNSYSQREKEIALASYKAVPHNKQKEIVISKDNNTTVVLASEDINKTKEIVISKDNNSTVVLASEDINKTKEDTNKTKEIDIPLDNNTTVVLASEDINRTKEDTNKTKEIDIPLDNNTTVVLASEDINKTKEDTNKTKEIVISKDNNSTVVLPSEDINKTKEDTNKTKEIVISKDNNSTVQTLITNVITVKNRELPIQKNIEIPQVILDIPKVITPENIEIPNVEITIPKVSKAISSNSTIPMAIEALNIEKVELNRTVEEKKKALELAQAKINLLQDKNQDLLSQIKESNQRIHQLEEKINSALYNNDNFKDKINKLQKELDFNKKRREKALNQKAKVESQLAIALKENKKIKENLTNELKSKELLLTEKTNLNSKIQLAKTNLINQKNQLEERIKKLKDTIVKIFIVTKKDAIKISTEYNSTIQKLKQNLSSELEKELSIMDKKTKLEEMVKSLEQNITAQIDEKAQLLTRIDKLKATVAKMLTIAKDGTEKATQEFNSKLQAFQSQKASIEQNLSVELEKEQVLSNEKVKLEDRVKSLEQNITAQTDEKAQLLTRIDKLKATVAKILTIAKEKTQEALVEYNTTIQKFQSKQKSLEENLSAQLKKEQILLDAKAKLEATVSEMFIHSKDMKNKITQEFNSKLQAFQSQKASIEQNLSLELEKEQALLDKKAKLEDRVKSLEQNITAQIDEKGQLKNRVNELKATVSKMLTTAKEQTKKITEEFTSKLQASQSQKASIEQNLSVEIEKEQALLGEKAKLEDRVKSLEQNITTQIDEKSQLENRVNELKATISKMLATAKEQTQKVTQEFNSKLQALQSQKLSIEQNLTNEIEKSQYLIDENNKLKEKIIEEKNNLEGQLRVKESEIEKLKIEKEKTIQKAKAKQVLLKTFLLTNVQFKRASSELTDESKARLNDTAQKMKKYPNFKYEIQGHTDKSGKEEYNIKLSTQRAEATKAYLISQGVSPDILVTKGFGSSKPIADNKTKEGRIKNRRVIFVIKE